jgi:hypothetical protein
MLNCHPQLIAIVTDGASQGMPTITSRNFGAGMTVLNAGRFAGLGAGNFPKHHTGFVAGVARNAHRRRELKAKRRRLLERCYKLTFGLCVHSSTETKPGSKYRAT